MTRTHAEPLHHQTLQNIVDALGVNANLGLLDFEIRRAFFAYAAKTLTLKTPVSGYSSIPQGLRLAGDIQALGTSASLDLMVATNGFKLEFTKTGSVSAYVPELGFAPYLPSVAVVRLFVRIRAKAHDAARCLARSPIRIIPLCRKQASKVVLCPHVLHIQRRHSLRHNVATSPSHPSLVPLSPCSLILSPSLSVCVRPTISESYKHPAPSVGLHESTDHT